MYSLCVRILYIKEWKNVSTFLYMQPNFNSDLQGIVGLGIDCSYSILLFILLPAVNIVILLLNSSIVIFTKIVKWFI